MLLSTLLLLPATLLSSVYASASSHVYNETLQLRPLPASSLYAGFTFTSTSPFSAYQNNNFRFFPRSLAQILQFTHTEELHLRFALGRWDNERWGARPRDGLREGGNGVELWAWIEGREEDTMERWGDLVNSLSGLFCASLNFVDEGKTHKPAMAFEAEGTLEASQAGKGTGVRKVELLHGMLPHEVVCTENLTPFIKLLPCKGKAGVASLLDGHKLFDANWQTMAIDVRPVCKAGEECVLEIQQTVDMVLSLPRSMRSLDDPIPRPPPIEEVVCDETKGYNSQDTCYPNVLDGETAWTLSGVFGRSIRGSCPLGNEGGWDVTLEVPDERSVELISDAEVPQRKSDDGLSRSYRLVGGQDFDISLPDQVLGQGFELPEPPLFASRQMTGYGAERGGMHILLRNPRSFRQRIVYLESLPWFLRPYMHTLRISGGSIEKMYYTPLLDRKRGTHLELLIDIPPDSTAELTYDFEKAILRYTEYPPDANRGFDVPAAIIRVLPSNYSESSIAPLDRRQGSYLRTTSLLLPLPTPDFSMPYNVIILTSTVIALGFGSIFNLLVRRFVFVEEVPVSPLAAAVKKSSQRLRDFVAKMKGAKDTTQEEKTARGDEKIGNGDLRERDKKDR